MIKYDNSELIYFKCFINETYVIILYQLIRYYEALYIYIILWHEDSLIVSWIIDTFRQKIPCIKPIIPIMKQWKTGGIEAISIQNINSSVFRKGGFILNKPIKDSKSDKIW